MNFIEKCVLGQIKDPFKSIDDYVENWHLRSTEGHYHLVKLSEYLGMTEKEYFSWLEDPSNLDMIIRSRKDGSFEALQILDKIREEDE